MVLEYRLLRAFIVEFVRSKPYDNPAQLCRIARDHVLLQFANDQNKCLWAG